MTKLPSFPVRLFSLPHPDFGLSQQVTDTLRTQQVLLEEYQNEPGGILLLALQGPDGLDNILGLLEILRPSKPVVLILWMGPVALLPYRLTCQLLHAGAADVIPWNLSYPIVPRINRRLERIRAVQQILASPKVHDLCLGEAPAWIKALHRLVEFARYSQAPVLLMGESGTGKELAARLVHELDCRPHKEDFVVLDCSTVSPELSGSEFFGHEKGAFTNAVANRDGAFSIAHLGTLFLDEVGELPLPMQAELLRVVQEGRYKRVGSNTWQKTDFRLVSATNRNLAEEAEKGSFRQDLFFRIAGAVVWLPPLRERREDIPVLARHFLAETLRTNEIPDFDPHLLTWLLTRDYPGNIRELRQLMTRLAARYPGGGWLTLSDLPESDRPSLERVCSPLEQPEVRAALRIALENGLGFKEMKHRLSNLTFALAVELANGNLQQAAQLLQVSDRLVQGWKAGGITKS